MKIGFVTDSTAYLPANLVAEFGIEVVPVRVVISGISYAEGVDVSPEDVASAFRSGKSVSTSRPNSSEFIAAYQRLLKSGYDHIISVHLSSKLSGTSDAARLAVAKTNLPVQVIDSGTVGMAMGNAICSAALLAKSGASVTEVISHLETQCHNSKVFFHVNSLDYLRRGGRISKIQNRIGSVLSLRPLLKVEDGEIAVQELVRTNDRAIARLIDLAISNSSESSKIVIMHVVASEQAQQIASEISSKKPQAEVIVLPAGAVISTHLGPRSIAVSINPSS